MAWLVLLVVFCKPVYYFARYLWSKFKTKDDTHSFWLEQAKNWGVELVKLVKP